MIAFIRKVMHCDNAPALGRYTAEGLEGVSGPELAVLRVEGAARGNCDLVRLVNAATAFRRRFQSRTTVLFMRSLRDNGREV